MIRVLIVDDHAIVRSGLGQLLSTHDDIEVVGIATDGREAAAQVRELGPDVILMDLHMPEVDGTEATRLITAAGDSRIVILTTFSDREKILAALDAGAIGYLLKDAEPEQIVNGVRAAAREESPLDPRAARAVLTARSAPAAHGLTDRERDVLILLVSGLSNKQIARRLGIAEKTVKAHLSNIIFRSIGVADRTQAALWAERNGLSQA